MKTCPKCGVEYPDAITLCPTDGAALEKDPDSLVGTTLAGKYRIDARLNEGGMGTVYRGCHVLMDKTVAIKVLRPSLAADEKIVARFSREARAASRITHPNAISVTDFGEDESGHVFLVMEFLSGRTLRHVIREEGPLPLARVVDITRQVGDALNAAHEQGIVHRDLKSDNIMLVDTMTGDHAKVLDFGIAKINEPDGAVDTNLTAPNLVIGTPQYMSPEQCSQDVEIDARSDIYSLGVILFEMLVGHVPFSGDSPTIVMMKHLQEPVPSVLEERSDLPASVARVVARAMAKVRDNRYQNVADLIEDLTIASGMTIHRLAPVGVTNTIQTPDPDEVTVVRPREVAAQVGPVSPVPPVQRREPVVVPVSGQMPPPAPAAAGFNPLKVLIPSVVGLLVVFAAIYAITRNSTPGEANTNQQVVPSLAADPNSQPVQPAQPATGRGEEGIPSGGSITPPANASPSASVAASPAATEDFTPDANANTNTNTNSNENSNGNSNRKAPPLPEPTRSVVPENVPPPVPSATKPPAEKPSPTATPPESLER
ncbi:MAG TPA: serine/threonine-protein kinase [Pyrinomonadaceae bacterium]|nr:serine/threonine-protein kinase [Pyrinomonadaceae bacterium]